MEVELLSITPEPEKLIESAGRTCYQSFNKYEAGYVEFDTPDWYESTITKTWEDVRHSNILGFELGKEYIELVGADGKQRWIPTKAVKPSYVRFIEHILKSGHLSVIEHAYATFRLKGISRSMSHQIVRHRLCSISQSSQRYIREDAFEYVTPDSVDTSPKRLIYQTAMDDAQNSYKQLAELGLRKEDARFVLPNACETEIVISANLREWIHIIEMRCDKHAQWEIRAVAGEILNILYKEAPIVFGNVMKKFGK